MPSLTRIHRRNGYEKNAYTYYPVIIVGAGVSGVAMGCRLKEVLGTDQFRIFERQSGIGGTWWINRYPGAACDVPAVFYSFSFCQKWDWSTIYPSAAEISQYLADVCEKYQIVDKIQFHTDISQLRWIAEDEEWEVTLSYLVPGTGDLSQHERDELAAQEGPHRVYVKTEIVRAKVVVSGVGGLVEPKTWPSDIPGFADFEGEITHTARWNSDIDFHDKDVVVFGAGCSAAQVVPELAKEEAKVRSITQIMRTPPWVQPDLLEPPKLARYEAWMPTLTSHVPGLARFLRHAVFWGAEYSWFVIFPNSAFGRRKRPQKEKQFLDNMRAWAPKEYHEMLTPNYPLGCKRRIINSDWYRSLNAPHVELTTQPMTHVHAKSVTLGPGSYYAPDAATGDDKIRDIPADVIVLGNGFETNQWLHPLKVIGKGGKDMQDFWDERGGPQAYLGIAMDHFPNFFMIFGPNTATGHTSVVFATENAVNYSLNFIKGILSGDVSSYEVKEEAERAWAQSVQNEMQKTVFRRGTCQSWYSRADGWNSSTYPWTQLHYWFRCTFPRWHDWSAKPTQKGLTKRRTRKAIRWFVLFGLFGGLAWLRKNPDRQVQLMETLRAGKDRIMECIR